MWSNITPASQLWPQPRQHHTVCTMVCKSQEIKVLLLGGHGARDILSDCWLLDVMRGIGEKVRKRREGEMQLEMMIGHCSVTHRSRLMVSHLVVVGVILLVVSRCWMAQ